MLPELIFSFQEINLEKEIKKQEQRMHQVSKFDEPKSKNNTDPETTELFQKLLEEVQKKLITF